MSTYSTDNTEEAPNLLARLRREENEGLSSLPQAKRLRQSLRDIPAETLLL